MIFVAKQNKLNVCKWLPVDLKDNVTFIVLNCVNLNLLFEYSRPKDEMWLKLMDMVCERV